MLLQDFSASAKSHKVHKNFFLLKSSVLYLYQLKSNKILKDIGQRKATSTEKRFYSLLVPFI